ncbi:Uncharacterised protein [uncultured archaeon]|nr:Uncharacterised protein [uncultured archaeon]
MIKYDQIKSTTTPSPDTNRLLSRSCRPFGYQVSENEGPQKEKLTSHCETRGHDFGRLALFKNYSQQQIEMPGLGQTLPGTGAGAAGTGRGPCDDHHVNDLINPAFAEARNWRRQTLNWLDAHLAHLRSRLITSESIPVGATILNELRLLNSHFGISRVINEAGGVFPRSPEERVNGRDIERFGQASYWVRRRFSEVDLTGLAFQCQPSCPRGRRGGDALGSVDRPGSSKITFHTNCFDPQHPKTRAGVAMHEAFHASFSEFDHDTYSFESNYPGDNPLTNAESFATFSAIAATGSGYRITVIPAISITGSP